MRPAFTRFFYLRICTDSNHPLSCRIVENSVRKMNRSAADCWITFEKHVLAFSLSFWYFNFLGNDSTLSRFLLQYQVINIIYREMLCYTRFQRLNKFLPSTFVVIQFREK